MVYVTKEIYIYIKKKNVMLEPSGYHRINYKIEQFIYPV